MRQHGVEDYLQVLQLTQQGLSTRTIAKQLGISRNTVSRLLKSKGERKPGSGARARRAPNLEVDSVSGQPLPKPINPNTAEWNEQRPGRSTPPTYRRCPTCGGKVLANYECMACTQKQYLTWDCYWNELLTVDTGAYPVLGLHTSLTLVNRQPNQ